MEKVQYRLWHILPALAGITFLVGASNLSLILALPAMVEDLDSTIFVIIWVVLAYTLVTNIGAIPMGKLGDIYGRRRMLIIGLSISIVANLLSFSATDANQLIVFRIIAGIGGSMTAGLVQAVAVDIAPKESRGRAIGFVTSGWAVGSLGGPVIGGVILTVTSWRSIFLFLAGATIIVLIIASMIIPKLGAGSRSFKFDFLGASLFAGSLTSLMVAMTIAMDPRVGGTVQNPLFALSAILFLLFLLAERRSKFPMIDFKMIRSRQYSLAISLGGLYTLAHHGFAITMTFYLLSLRGFSTLETAAILMIIPFFGLMNVVGGWISDKISFRIPVTLGIVIMIFGYLGLSLRAANLTLAELVLYVSLAGIGGLLSWVPTTSMALGAVKKVDLGVASGILFSLRSAGGQIGQALVIFILAVFTGGNLDTIFRVSGSPSVTDLSRAFVGVQYAFAASVVIFVISLGIMLVSVFYKPKAAKSIE